ncbi:hypothetical protein KAT59_05775 [Candidatus Bipolaricaulota bacterium]|nr:hypothetical protein [Candidatus Bipolaricaulota bacterium]
MVHRVAGLSLIVCLLGVVLAGASPASLGSAFADSYTAFAPLYTAYRSYADYLFYGSEVAIPPGLNEACADVSDRLVDLHMAFIVQTDSQRVEEVTRLARLRSSVASFCRDYQEQIAAIGNLSEPDLDLFTQAADAGMFAAIYELNKQLEGVFTIALESYEGTKDGWAFSVSFAIRALLNQGPIEQVDPTLKEILLGPEEEPFSRKDLPAKILPEIDAFAALIGKSLTADEQEEMASLAQTIYTFLNP